MKIRAYLVQLERHPHSWSNYAFQQLHIRKNPFVPQRRNTEIPFEKCVETIEEKFNTAKIQSDYEFMSICLYLLCFLLFHWFVELPSFDLSCYSCWFSPLVPSDCNVQNPSLSTSMHLL